ncbi:MAG: phosphoribosylanthranilate isomerase [Nitrospirae bacterium]|nr:phosphoribosylanthranilate isomerase [Nitrospirota bacterium]
MVRVKVCGITNAKDAERAILYGCHALGFIFYANSPRAVTVETARAIVRDLPPLVETVGVFVDESEGRIRKTLEATGIQTVQLHGEEAPAFCARFEPRAIKAIRMQGGGWMERLDEYRVRGILLDGFVDPHESGVAGRKRWTLAREAASKRVVILAGGLTPSNVAEAIGLVHPYGVDVSRGVERNAGVKDWSKLKAFMEAVQGAA